MVSYFRVIPDRWKGMSPSQVSEILHTQALQREEKLVCTKNTHEEASTILTFY